MFERVVDDIEFFSYSHWVELQRRNLRGQEVLCQGFVSEYKTTCSIEYWRVGGKDEMEKWTDDGSLAYTSISSERGVRGIEDCVVQLILIRIEVLSWRGCGELDRQKEKGTEYGRCVTWYTPSPGPHTCAEEAPREERQGVEAALLAKEQQTTAPSSNITRTFQAGEQNSKPALFLILLRTKQQAASYSCPWLLQDIAERDRKGLMSIQMCIMNEEIIGHGLLGQSGDGLGIAV
ncbi:hypothetical protein M436DRAFT_64335 [Aureobasidium namibiae CBS 147.97]|uniref:Uncharacterized protein n=1 Tax=Aureobasidium namibiae CBS 147.97 TaxID=1043004 RepID=A0A074WGU7_9PEZI|nr:uncharacterized protein M436DRAFT_64335 [Aureobasidium namibiae CBS 147.97]KEQ72320.1 hypothetical protein M436DRAFT_64335 [Aureobasidium namibiae CBS 147.97]